MVEFARDGLPRKPSHCVPIASPILFTAGSADVVCEDECALNDFKEVRKSNHLFFDVEGIGHMDPTSQGQNHEIQVVTYFL